MKIHSAKYISECLMCIANQNEEFDITNLKLQKLLYYIQGASLAMHGQRMFRENITKWQYGPVVEHIYHYYKSFGSQIITAPEKVDLTDLNEKQLKVIENVFEYFGQFSALKLMNFTHSELPWFNTEMSQEMTDEVLIEYFNTIVIKGDGKKEEQ